MRKLGMLQSMGSQRVGHNLVTDKQQQTLSTLGFSHWENACKLLLTVLSWKWHSKKMERDWLERIWFWKRNPDHMNGGHETEGNLTVSVLPRVWVSYFVKDSWRLSSRIILRESGPSETYWHCFVCGSVMCYGEILEIELDSVTSWTIHLLGDLKYFTLHAW